MQSKATKPQDYIDSLPDERKKPMMQLRRAILKNLPKGFEETMQYGMLSYVVPHSLYPQGYHAKPTDALPFISLASQKNFISFYHMGLYKGKLLDWFTDEWPVYTKQKLDMGKSCVRMKKMDDIPVDLIGELCTKITPQQWIAIYEKQKDRK